MATNKQVTVTTTRQSIVSTDDVTQHVYLHAKHAIYIGDEGVTSSNGFLMDSDDKIDIRLNAGESLSAVAAASSGTLHILITAIR
jgi:hypothetical protein